MNTQGKVNKRLFKKTELTTQKVDLAKISDLENSSSEAYSIIKEITKTHEALQSQISKYNQANKQYKIDIASAKSIFKTHNNLIDDLQSQLKALGLSPNDVPQLKEAINIGSDLRKVANDMPNYSNI